MSKRRRFIWSNDNLPVRRWLQKYKNRISDEDYAVITAALELFQKEYKQAPDCLEDLQLLISNTEYGLLTEYNEQFLFQERQALSVNVGSPIILIAFSHPQEYETVGYKVIKSGMISDCLQPGRTSGTWYIDACGDLRCDLFDDLFGISCYLYRAVKDEITEVQLKAFLSEILDGHISAERITAVTKRLGPQITDAYGLSRRGYRAYGKG